MKILKNLGLDAYRFSISWPRVLPGTYRKPVIPVPVHRLHFHFGVKCYEFFNFSGGRLCNGVNKEGIDFYNRFIDDLLANGII